jgi:hypothetical protein
MTDDPARGLPRHGASPIGTLARFCGGAVAGIGALGLFLAIDRTSQGGLLALAACLAGAGAVVSFGGLAAFLGAWVALVLPWLVLALLAGPECVASTDFLPMGGICPRPFYLVVAGLMAAFGGVVVGGGFLLARSVRWALGGPGGGDR